MTKDMFVESKAGTEAHKYLAASSLPSRVETYLQLLATVARSKPGALSFMRANTLSDQFLRDRNLPIHIERTLLGCFLMASPVPPDPRGKFYFFDQPKTASMDENRATEKFIWSNTNGIIDSLFTMLNNCIRSCPEAREAFLNWIGLALKANRHRGRPYNPEVERVGSGYRRKRKLVSRTNNQLKPNLPPQLPPAKSSSGFVANLLHILLRFCQPFLSHRDPKQLRINWLYPQCKKNHLSFLKDETPLIPRPDDAMPVDVPDSVASSFLTAVFFLTQQAIKIGFTTTWNEFTGLSRQLGRIRELYQQTQATASGSPEMQRVGGRCMG